MTAGENRIVVRCYDNGRDPSQYTGKQIYFNYYNKSCYYTRCTGIWQTVWMEYVPNNYITEVKLTPDVDNKKLDAVVTFADTPSPAKKLMPKCFLEGKHIQHGILQNHRKSRFLLHSYAQCQTLESGASQSLRPEADLRHGYGHHYFGMRKIAVNGYAIELNE